MLQQGRAYELVQLTARHFGVPVSELLGRGRSKRLTHARHVAMWLVRHEDAGWSYPEIGRLFERDHSSVWDAVRSVEASPVLREQALAIIRQTRAQQALEAHGTSGARELVGEELGRAQEHYVRQAEGEALVEALRLS